MSLKIRSIKLFYVSATPGDYELEKVDNKVVEQIIRPTGLLDQLLRLGKPKDRLMTLGVR